MKGESRQTTKIRALATEVARIKWPGMHNLRIYVFGPQGKRTSYLVRFCGTAIAGPLLVEDEYLLLRPQRYRKPAAFDSTESKAYITPPYGVTAAWYTKFVVGVPLMDIIMEEYDGNV